MSKASLAARGRSAMASISGCGTARVSRFPMAPIIEAPRAHLSSCSSRLTEFNPLEYSRAMHTVQTIIHDVYGDERKAAERFGLVPSAVWNWKKWGHFPLRLVFMIAEDARAKGIEIAACDVPVSPKHKTGVAA